jgi:hypothetical protein
MSNPFIGPPGFDSFKRGVGCSDFSAIGSQRYHSTRISAIESGYYPFIDAFAEVIFESAAGLPVVAFVPGFVFSVSPVYKWTSG